MRKKIIFVASLIVLVLLIVNLLFRGGFFSEFLKSFLTHKLEEEFHASVSVDKVRLNLFPPFLIANGLIFKEKPQDPLPLLKTDQIILSFSPVSLLTEFLLVHKIQLQDPEIHLIWDENGKTNFDFLFQTTLPNKKFPLVIQKLILSNASLDINQKHQNNRVMINSLELKMEADPTMTHFQIAGSSKDFFYQWGKKGSGVFSTSEWKLIINPAGIDIKKMTITAPEGFLSIKGLINLTSRQEQTPFKLDSDFRFNTKKKSPVIDSLTGHGQLIGSFGSDKKMTGNLKLSQLTAEKGKSSHNIGEFKGHFSYDFHLFHIDQFTSNLFGGKMEGSLKIQSDENASSLETEYFIHHLPLNRLAFLFSTPYKKYLEGKTLDSSGTLKMRSMDLHQIEAAGHLHLNGIINPDSNPKNPFWDNAMISLRLAETDYEYNPASLALQNTSLQIGSSFIHGNGSVQKDGTIHSYFSLRSERGGEIFSWLGYSQWEGSGEFSGEIQGTLSSPTLQGKGSVNNVFFDHHSLGEGTTDLEYSNQQLHFFNTRIIKGPGQYSGEGLVHWDSLEKYTYHISTHASRGVPDDIVTVFIENIPLNTQATGAVMINGDEKTFNIKGNLNLERGSLYDELFDRGHVEFEITERKFIFLDVSLVHGLSTISGKGEIAFQGSYQGEIRSENFHLQDLSALNKSLPALEGSFKGLIQGEGTFDHPMLKLSGVLPEVTYKNQKLSDGIIELSLRGKELQGDLKFKEHPISMNGSLILAKPFLSKLQIQGDQIPVMPLLSTTSGFQLTPFAGTISGKLDIEGPLSEPQHLNYSANLTRLDADFSGYTLSNREDILFQLKDGILNIESFHLKGEGTSLSIAGGLQLFKQYNLFITGEADLSLLKAFTREITYGKGKAYLALSIYDNWNDPKFQGGLTVQDGQIRTSAFSQPFHISSMGLFFNERQVFLESLDAELGEGGLHVTGKIDINRFKMGHFGLIVETKESRFTFFPGWASTVSGTLIYQGDSIAQNLQGELILSHGIYNKKFDLKPLLKKLVEIRESTRPPIPVVGNTRLNIHLSGEDDLRINNNVARLPFTIDLTLKGTVDHPVLIGRMESDSGFIVFYNKTFNVSSIAVDFIDPEAIKPLIDLKARTQIMGKDRNYQIDLGLSGTPEEFNRTLTSDDPTLTETDILALILAGRKATEVATDPYSQQQIGGQFVPLVIESPLEGLLEELTGVNRLSIEPVSPGLRSTGGPRVTVEQRLLNDRLLLNYSYIMNPSQDQVIQMDYLINHHIYLQGIRNEEGNVGGNLKFRFEFK